MFITLNTYVALILGAGIFALECLLSRVKRTQIRCSQIVVG